MSATFDDGQAFPTGYTLPVEVQAASGRGYLRGAVTLAEHAAVLLDHLPADEIEPVPGMVERLERALDAIRRECGMRPSAAGSTVPPAAPAPQPAAPATDGGLW